MKWKKTMMMMDVNVIKQCEAELLPDETIWSEDDESIYWLKKALNHIQGGDKIIMLMYIECASYRVMAKQLGLSHTIIRKQIMQIKQQMYDYIRINCPNNNSVLLDRFKQLFNNNKKSDMEDIN